jgi:predicted signal transduction protein with EAL and GGDEF domain
MIAALVFAACFYGIAEYEHMTAWPWAVASLVVSFAVLELTGTLILVIPAQVVLFGVLWWRNVKRIDKLPEEQAARAEADRVRRQAMVQRAQERSDREKRR